MAGVFQWFPRQGSPVRGEVLRLQAHSAGGVRHHQAGARQT